MEDMKIFFPSNSNKLLMLFALCCISTFCLIPQPVHAIKKSYVVYLGEHSHGLQPTSEDFDRAIDSHHQFLASFLRSKEEAKDAIFYSYTRSINGFAATLDEDLAAQIAKHPDVVSIFLNQGYKLHTIHSWDFLMLEKNGVVLSSSLWDKANFGKDVIIATLDTGVWPESKSFSDEGYGPVPSKWKGICQNDTDIGVHCNRKLIGARYYNEGYKAAGGEVNSSKNTARDYAGHGTHTLSTAGGNFVTGANVFGVANGTAKGGSPRARVAAYKVCWPELKDQGECFDADILQAFDMAIHDGVDVISVSLGGSPVEYLKEAQAIGAFHALKKGIVTVCSAGNDGPTQGTVTNIAPWIITVGASTIDREFSSYVELRNGLRLKGQSLSKGLPEDRFYPLIKSADAKADNATIEAANLCELGSLDPKKAKGKIVVCLRGDNARMDKGKATADAGASGMILCNAESDGDDLEADPHVIPATHINYTDGLSLYAYLNSTTDPLGFITHSKAQYNVKPAPAMAPFSSTGPNKITPEILKPDITAPGVDIIAAYPEAKELRDTEYGKRNTPFQLMSGTSMSCPHVSGVAALLKSLHPDWSPSAIRSAIMTTARTRDNTGKPMLDSNKVKATPLNYGAGHIRPNRAMDPGLVYDLTVLDYIDFLCGFGYNKTQIETFANGTAFTCPEINNILNMNYPSITVPKMSGSVTVTRTLKNVGTPGVYKARLRNPAGIEASVEPRQLTFDHVGDEKSFELTLKVKRGRLISHNGQHNHSFGQLLWTDGTHYVRSPITVSSLF